MPSTNPKLLERARQMRSEMTQPERELWMALRAKRFAGVFALLAASLHIT